MSEHRGGKSGTFSESKSRPIFQQDQTEAFFKDLLELQALKVVFQLMKAKTPMVAENHLQILQPRTSVRNLAAVFICLVLAACSLIAPYDQAAYDKATGAKATALALMDKATASYESYHKEIESASLEIDKAYEYDRGRGAKNVETIKQWEILKDPKGHLFGGFIRRWREKGSFSQDYIDLKKPDIADAFDQIIALERGKPKSK